MHPWGGTSRTTRYLFTDHQGSIAYSVVNRASTQLGFFPYGKRMNTTPAQNFSQLGYTGHYQDDDLNLINMRGRIYDVSMHRFLTSRRRLRRADAGVRHERLRVRHARPVNFVDPTGFQTAPYQGQSSTDCRSAGDCATRMANETMWMTPDPLIGQRPPQYTNHQIPPTPSSPTSPPQTQDSTQQSGSQRNPRSHRRDARLTLRLSAGDEGQ